MVIFRKVQNPKMFLQTQSFQMSVCLARPDHGHHTYQYACSLVFFSGEEVVGLFIHIATSCIVLCVYCTVYTVMNGLASKLQFELPLL